jgi:hypothetical protein
MRRRLLVIAAIGAFLIPIPILADVIATDILLIRQADTRDEDVYVLAESGKVAGTIDGDLVMVTSDLSISGTVTGDVFIATHGSLIVTGHVEGSVRGVARDTTITGVVDDDVALVTGTLDVSGSVGRDVLVLAGTVRSTGSIGRDLKGRFASGSIDGDVGRDVDVTVARITVGDAAAVHGDFLYRADSEARIEAGASIAGQTARLSSRGTFFVRTFLNAVTIIGTLAFFLCGVLLLWLFRSTASRAVGAVLTRPGRVLAVGTAAVIVVPLFTVLAAATLVGIPIAIALVTMIGLTLIFGPVPAVTAAGVRLTRARYGLYAAFVVGGILWRVGIWLLPLLGVLLYLGALVIGVGGWLVGAWEQRARASAPPVAVAGAAPE